MKNVKNLFFTTVLSSALILSAGSLMKASLTEFNHYSQSEGIEPVDERPFDRDADWMD